jgi:hypothetical protein
VEGDLHFAIVVGVLVLTTVEEVDAPHGIGLLVSP